MPDTSWYCGVDVFACCSNLEYTKSEKTGGLYDVECKKNMDDFYRALGCQLRMGG